MTKNQKTLFIISLLAIALPEAVWAPLGTFVKSLVVSANEVSSNGLLPINSEGLFVALLGVQGAGSILTSIILYRAGGIKNALAKNVLLTLFVIVSLAIIWGIYFLVSSDMNII